MHERPTHATSPWRTASVVLSVAALAYFGVGMLLSWSRVAVLLLPVVLGAIALGLAIRARRPADAGPGRVVAFVMSALAIITPAATIVAVLLAGAFAPSASYMLTVESPESVTVVIRNGADSTTQQWNSGRTITLDSSQTVVGIDVRSATPTTTVSCELRRNGRVVATEQHAGSVDCGYNAGRD